MSFGKSTINATCTPLTGKLALVIDNWREITSGLRKCVELLGQPVQESSYIKLEESVSAEVSKLLEKGAVTLVDQPQFPYLNIPSVQEGGYLQTSHRQRESSQHVV